MTANQTRVKRKRGGQKGNRNARKHGFFSGTLSPAETRQMWNITNLEGVDPEIGLTNIESKPTKRIVRTLTTEPSGGNRLTYEKELLNSRKNSHFCKTNHPGFPHALPPVTRREGCPSELLPSC